MEKFSTITPDQIKKPNRPVKRVFIHCSASDHAHHDDAKIIEEWHKARKFNEIGYHFFIKKNGDIQVGRNLERTPAAQEGNNLRTIAICLHGLRKELFTIAQMTALKNLCHRLHFMYNGKVSFHGHCEVSAKACPVFDYRSVLKLKPDGFIKMGS
jgi:N-acetyl-anhydromuramyl-L-alanine amidase AmpD